MKNNNFHQPQNYLNNPLNKNPYRIQNYNYMFYLVQDNPQLLYNIQNYYLQLYQLGLLQMNQNTQIPQLFNLTNAQNIQNVLPLYYNIPYNNLLQLRLLNANNNILVQNQNMLPNIKNNSFQNIQNNLNNSFLNKKTFNSDHLEVIKDNEIEKKYIENNNINEEEKVINNNILIRNETKINDNNLEIKNIEKKDEENNDLEEKNEIQTTKKEENNEISTIKKEENKEISTIKKEENNEISTIKKEKNNEISRKKEENYDISTTKNEKKEEEKIKTKTEKNKKKKKRTNYKDLLYDSLLEHLDKEEKTDSKNDIELEEEGISTSNANTIKKEKNKKSSNVNNTKTNQKQKSRNKNGKHSRKKQHKTTLKNNKDILADLEGNKNNEDNLNYPRIIFHGKDYKKTKNINEFMKYNFNFTVDETKKLITDYDQHYVDIKTLNDNTNIYDNYNYSEQHLDDINNLWSREKFIGDNNELKKAINIISDSFNERKIYTNEEKYLDIIKKNNYIINEFVNKEK